MAAPRSAATPRARIRSHFTGERPWIRPYDRRRDLPRLVPLLETDIGAASLEAHVRLVGLLRKALRLERQRARSRHWTYDPARHAALVKACRLEIAALRARSSAATRDAVNAPAARADRAGKST